MGKSAVWWGIPAKTILVAVGMALGYYLQLSHPEVHAAVCGLRV